jgi:hypothetical protein
MAVNAAPTMIPTAMSMTLPLAMKSLNSLIMTEAPPVFDTVRLVRAAAR